MEFSDEESEILPQCVSTYHLVDQNNNPISFAALPVKWNEDESIGNLGIQVYLRGTTDDGLQEFYNQVVAWKFELSFVKPEIWLLSKNKTWILLKNPRRSFKFIIRTILITVHWLHYAKKNHEASGNAIREYLQTTFGSFEVEPSESDLLDHIPLIREAARRDKDLAKSKFLLTFMEKLRTNISFHEDVQIIKKPKFIVDSDEDEGFWSEEAKAFFGLCAICDDGGNVLFCEGRCLRSFHATIASGIDNSCESLGYTQAQVDAVPTFMCKNCVHQQHQCFVCGMLGSSNKSSCQEVFPCVSATCGNFYHPGCVAKLLHPDNESLGEQLQLKIAAGESFTCPVHKCFVCKQSEDKTVDDFQFAMCRRCPKAYHRKCLPREIAFESTANNAQRAWSGLLPNERILIYCLEHEIIKELGTPVRNHLIFPGDEGKRKKQLVVASKRSLLSESRTKKTIVRKLKPVEVYSGVKTNVSTMKIEKGSPRQDIYPSKKPNIFDTGRKSLKDTSDISKQCDENLARVREKRGGGGLQKRQ
ncbi:hypothetical protein ACOSP7_002824 [Xanthoceras sorbifolium]